MLATATSLIDPACVAIVVTIRCAVAIWTAGLANIFAPNVEARSEEGRLNHLLVGCSAVYRPRPAPTAARLFGQLDYPFEPSPVVAHLGSRKRMAYVDVTCPIGSAFPSE